MDRKNPPKVEKLTQEVVPLKRLGYSTLERPIPEKHMRIHAAVIARARRERQA